MVEIFTEGGMLPLGHHEVTLKVAEDRDGDQMVMDTPKGPRVTFKLTSTSGGGSIRARQTFNLNCMGLISGINQCFGFTKGQADELVSEMPTATGFDAGSVHNLCALWASSEGGWIEVVPDWKAEGRREDGSPYSEVKFRRGAPPVVKKADDPSYAEDYVAPEKS